MNTGVIRAVPLLLALVAAPGAAGATAAPTDIHERMLTAARQALVDAMPAHVTTLEAAPVGAVPRALCGDGGVSDIRATARSLSRVRSREWVDVEIHCADGRRSTVAQWFEVRAQGRVPVAAVALAPGTPVDAHVEWMSRELTELHDAPPAPDQLPLLQARGAVRAGEVLLAGRLQRIPDVARGQRVVARVRSGNVVLSVPAVADRDAFQGMPVRVTRLDRQESLMATVSGKASVEVQP